MRPACSAVARRDPSFQPFPRCDPGPNGGSWAPPRPPALCVCPGRGAGQAAYPRGAGRGSPRCGTALWGRESRGGASGWDWTPQDRGSWGGIPTGCCTPTPPPGRPGEGRGAAELTCPLAQAQDHLHMLQQRRQGPSEFLHGLIIHLGSWPWGRASGPEAAPAPKAQRP